MPGIRMAEGILERSHRFGRSNFEPARPFAKPVDSEHQFDAWCQRANGRVHNTIRAVPAERIVEERTRMRALPERPLDLDRRFVIRVPAQPYLRWHGNDYSIRPSPGRT